MKLHTLTVNYRTSLTMFLYSGGRIGHHRLLDKKQTISTFFDGRESVKISRKHTWDVSKPNNSHDEEVALSQIWSLCKEQQEAVSDIYNELWDVMAGARWDGVRTASGVTRVHVCCDNDSAQSVCSPKWAWVARFHRITRTSTSLCLSL